MALSYAMRYELPILAATVSTVKVASGRVFELKQGRYHGGRFPNDKFTSASWEITHNGKVVARLYDGYVYGWGNFHGSLAPVRGVGVGLDSFDHNQHDTGPTTDFAAAIQLLCFRADYILSARQKKEAA